MYKTPALYILLGLLVGSIVGFGIGIVNGDVIHGMQLGSLGGVFIGWIMTALALQK